MRLVKRDVSCQACRLGSGGKCDGMYEYCGEVDLESSSPSMGARLEGADSAGGGGGMVGLEMEGGMRKSRCGSK